MNRSEYVEYELEENVKKLEKLKLDYKLKNKQYLEALGDSKNSDDKKDIEEKKQFLLTLQDRHKKEIEALRERHKLEREGALWDYNEAKTHKTSLLSELKVELSGIQKELLEINKSNLELNKERHKLRKLNQLNITSHAIVQYLDRAKGEDINSIKKEIANIRGSKSSEVQDHEVVEFLEASGKINIEEIEKEMVPEKIKNTILSDELLGMSGTFKRRDGFRLVVRNSSIITFLPKEDKPKKNNRIYGERVKRPLRRMKL